VFFAPLKPVPPCLSTKQSISFLFPWYDIGFDGQSVYAILSFLTLFRAPQKRLAKINDSPLYHETDLLLFACA